MPSMRQIGDDWSHDFSLKKNDIQGYIKWKSLQASTGIYEQFYITPEKPSFLAGFLFGSPIWNHAFWIDLNSGWCSLHAVKLLFWTLSDAIRRYVAYYRFTSVSIYLYLSIYLYTWHMGSFGNGWGYAQIVNLKRLKANCCVRSGLMMVTSGL